MSTSLATAERLTWSKASVAHALGISEATFDKKRHELETEHGFPAKLPGLNLWSIAAVRIWVRTNGRAEQALVIPNDDPEISAVVGMLEREYGGAAA